MCNSQETSDKNKKYEANDCTFICHKILLIKKRHNLEIIDASNKSSLPKETLLRISALLIA